MSSRYVVLDTETTGLSPSEGHRLIEIGCIEILDRKFSGNRFHEYIQPDRLIDSGAMAVHGITNESLVGKPRFKDIADKLFQFLEGAELVIHNAPFDLGFLNHEFKLAGLHQGTTLELTHKILDTLPLARKMHPGQKNTLDALCKRYEVDNSSREFHGALLDAQLLAQVYLQMTGGQSLLALAQAEPPLREGDVQASSMAHNHRIIENLLVIKADDAELNAHQHFLKTQIER